MRHHDQLLLPLEAAEALLLLPLQVLLPVSTPLAVALDVLLCAFASRGTEAEEDAGLAASPREG